MSIASTVSRSFAAEAAREPKLRLPAPTGTPDAEASKAAPADTLGPRLIDYFPSEIVAFYTALLGLPFVQGQTVAGVSPKIWLYLISLALTILLVVCLVQMKYRAMNPGWTMRGLLVNLVARGLIPAGVAMVAFSLWAFALPGSELQKPVLGGLVGEGEEISSATIISGAIATIAVVLWRPALRRAEG